MGKVALGMLIALTIMMFQLEYSPLLAILWSIAAGIAIFTGYKEIKRRNL